MKKQKAIGVGFDKMHGPMNMQELNDLLDQGWLVLMTEQSGGGDILVILEKEETV